MFPTYDLRFFSTLVSIFILVKIFEIALAIVLALEDTPNRKKRRKWSKKWFLRRHLLGHARLLRELRDDEPHDYRNFLRMDAASYMYDEFLNVVRPIIVPPTHTVTLIEKPSINKYQRNFDPSIVASMKLFQLIRRQCPPYTIIFFVN